MGSSHNDPSFRELAHPNFSEFLKLQNNASFKLIKTVADFSQQLAQIHEQHADDLQALVENFRRRQTDLRKEWPPGNNSLLQSWELFLQQVESDSQSHGEIASILGRKLGQTLLEKTFHRKIQSRKIFLHRDMYEGILTKADEALQKSQADYFAAYQQLLTHRASGQTAYLEAHNLYVQNLRAANAMIHEFNTSCLPTLLEELDEIYDEISYSVADVILQSANIFAAKGQGQQTRYEDLGQFCRSVNSRVDLANLIKNVFVHQQPLKIHSFISPVAASNNLDGHNGTQVAADGSSVSLLGDDVVLDVMSVPSAREREDALGSEAFDLECQVKQVQDAVDSLTRMQQRSLETNLFSKADDLEEEICTKKFELRALILRLAAVRAQLDLFKSKLDVMKGKKQEDFPPSAYAGAAAQFGPGTRNKWLKAFKSLKTTGPAPPPPPAPCITVGPSVASVTAPVVPAATNVVKEVPTDSSRFVAVVSAVMAIRKGGSKDRDSASLLNINHIFQEYTYKKITACDVCQEILRGHTRQGMKCRLCKMNVHLECQNNAAKCKPKSRLLLRRQKSTSEIEAKLLQDNQDQCGERHLAGRQFGSDRNIVTGDRSGSSSSRPELLALQGYSSAARGGPAIPLHPSGEYYNVPSVKRFSYAPKATPTSSMLSVGSVAHSSSAPASPVHHRQHLPGSRPVHGHKRVEYQDDRSSPEDSVESPMVSPQSQRPLYHRNDRRASASGGYVALYNFIGRLADELHMSMSTFMFAIKFMLVSPATSLHPHKHFESLRRLKERCSSGSCIRCGMLAEGTSTS
ncbi:unnamed protein product [Notodromas monacha]|uniref:Phorbol-ester/DAG-type domain-containing protein n=1 Tax=Notodromas monacha TaxID=399045 RepID=A0A7R9GEW3_9CRUS|nr:unnamed protein product [Notodromas monacha]CAG0918265.1 unnamed protein product [Notodromas monacha]